MTPMWQTLLKILVLLFAMFTAIVLICSEMSKRHDAESLAINATKELAVLRYYIKRLQLKEVTDFESMPKELKAMENDAALEDIFIVTNEPGVILWNTTTADSAPLMPIPTKSGDPPQNQSPNRHYHQYHSLSQPDQYFKGSKPDAVQADQPEKPAQHRVPSNSTFRYQPCGKDSNEESRSFCTQVDDYPDLSALKVKLENKFAKFFLDDLQPTDVSARVGSPDDDEVFLCKTNRRIMYPKKGQRADNTWQLIVNNEEYKQGIQIEECEGADQPCDYTANFPNTYKPICKQHYVLQNLASIETSGKLDVVQQTFKIPSCCKCALKRV
ncbi:protein spaetzle isoform X2 [Drosophila gunungcola]|uniref:protein spaetzle isoform X2 n=1 Tax=Drosophila gunungcola TaxID=103775 RepID=UPI0022E35953|nr:protein spaetzle isoform X2 [Drosophila gunungcola]